MHIIEYLPKKPTYAAGAPLENNPIRGAIAVYGYSRGIDIDDEGGRGAADSVTASGGNADVVGARIGAFITNKIFFVITATDGRNLGQCDSHWAAPCVYPNYFITI